MTAAFAGNFPLVVAGRAHRTVRDANGIDQRVRIARVADADRPRGAIRPAPSQVQITAGVDAVAPARLQLARRHVDRQTFGDRSQIQNQWAGEYDGPPVGIQPNVAIADRASWREVGSNRVTRAALPIEPLTLHLEADRWIEGPASLLGNRHGKPHRFVEDLADGHRHADLRGELHQLASVVEPAATLLDLTKPLEAALHQNLRVGDVLLAGPLAGDFDRDEGAHEHGGAAVDLVHHCASARAATTA